jgi:hypothetical protein
VQFASLNVLLRHGASRLQLGVRIIRQRGTYELGEPHYGSQIDLRTPDLLGPPCGVLEYAWKRTDSSRRTVSTPAVCAA